MECGTDIDAPSFSAFAAMSPKVSDGVKDEMATPAETPSKRLLKRQAKKAKWEVKRKIKRQNERAKKKEKRHKLAHTEFSRNALKRRKMETSNCKIGVVIDLSFDEYMNVKDLNKTVKQVHFCYSHNRRQPNPLQFHVTSFKGDSAKLMEKNIGFSNWDVRFHEESFDEVFDQTSIVYLTSDSENVLQNLEPHKFYIIGGLVDHNSKKAVHKDENFMFIGKKKKGLQARRILNFSGKGMCLEKAISKNVSHARLPIDELLDMKTRKVLSIVHVFEILAKVAGGSSWVESLLTVIPQRKQAEVKEVLKQDVHSKEAV